MSLPRMHAGGWSKWLSLIFVFLVFGEISFRIIAKELLEDPVTEFNLSYRYHDVLGWFPIEGSNVTFTGSNTISIQHNNRGFRDHDHGVKSKKRMIFLGDSFVWGYDVEAKDRFTNVLQDSFPDWDVINLGVSGYGTDQAFLLLQEHYEFYQPDMVFLIYHYMSDPTDNSVNKNYGHYYKPFYNTQGRNYELAGVPVPRGLNYFVANYPIWAKSYLIRGFVHLYASLRFPVKVNRDPTLSANLIVAMRNYLAARGTEFAIGFTATGPKAEAELCRTEKLNCIDLSTDFRFPSHGHHWTPEGHREVGRLLYSYLRSEGY